VGFLFPSYKVRARDNDWWDNNYYNHDNYALYYHYTRTVFTFNVSTGFVFKGGFTLSLSGFCGFGKGKTGYEYEDGNYTYIVGGCTLAIGYLYRFKEKEK